MAIICWPLAGILLVGSLGYLVYHSRSDIQDSFVRVILLTIGATLVIIPPTVHNYKSGTPALISTGGAFNLYLGNNPNWQETSLVRPGYQWEKLITLPYRLYEEKEVNRLGNSAIFYQQIRKYIIQQPGQFLKTLFIRTYQLFDGYEIISPTDPYYFKQYSHMLNGLIFKQNWLKFPFGVLFPLAAIGLFSSLAHRKKRFRGLLFLHLSAMAFGLILFSITSRYRLFIIPFLSIYASIGLYSIFHLQSLRTKQIAVLILIAGISFVLANVDLLGLEKNYARPEVRSQPYFALGRILIRQNKYKEAIPPLEQAVRIDPGYSDSWVDIGRARYMTGDRDGAIMAMKTAGRVSPDYPLPLYNLARIYDVPGGSPELAHFYYTAYLRAAEKYFETKLGGENKKRFNTVKKRLQTLQLP